MNCPQARGFTLVELLVVIAIIGILVALLLPAIQAAREAARRAQCQSNIKNVALAVLNYESAKKVLPVGMSFNPALRDAISYGLRRYGPNWIIEILPYLEEQALYDKFELNLPINNNTSSARNREARGRQIPVLMCPSDPNNQVLYVGTYGPALTMQHGDNWARTNYAGNAGRADIWPDGPDRDNDRYMTGADSAGWLDDCKRGVMGPNASVKLGQITDGTTNTIMIGEIRAGLTENDARGIWAMGHAGPSLLAGYGAGGDDNGPNVCNAVHREDDVFSDTCGDKFAASICMSCDPDYFAQATVRSVHTGGAYLAMCDGSVQFVSDDIETTGATIGSSCCGPWDYMIASGDSERGGRYNRITLSPCL
jgi:prepilin-type N-terminal cleavage/methylation domain-containing protein